MGLGEVRWGGMGWLRVGERWGKMGWGRDIPDGLEWE